MKVIGFASDDGNVGQLTSDGNTGGGERLKRGTNTRGPDFANVSPTLPCRHLLASRTLVVGRYELGGRRVVNRGVFASRNS